MSTTLVSLGAAAVALSLFGYPLVRAASRRTLLAGDIALHLAVAALSSALPTETIFGIYVASRILLIALFVAGARRVVPIEPWRWMLLAGAVYLSVLPHQLRWPIDGDEPYYVLQAHSIVHDFDLDLRNQYVMSSRIIGREIGPQLGDPIGPSGQLWSRHEPTFALLLALPVAIGGITGASIFVALLSAAAAFLLARLLEDEDVAPRARTIAMFAFAFAPPLLFYATRIWPETLAALFLLGMTTALRNGRDLRAAFFGVALSLLKLRFLPIVLIVLLFRLLLARREGGRAKLIVIAALAIVLPALVMSLAIGDATGIHDFREVVTPDLKRYAVGLSGLLLDAQNGLLFQAPMLAVGAFLLFARRVRMHLSVRLLAAGALAYLFLLAPRAEWHGGWSPPLRYLVVFAPLLSLALAHGLKEARSALADVMTAGAVLSAAIVAHGLARPWELFHIANGESLVGEVLSTAIGADVSRLLPSAVRPNTALVAIALGLPAALFLYRFGRRIFPIRQPIAIPAILLFSTALLVRASVRPGSIVHFEDSHVRKAGGSLFPDRYQVQRFLFDGGWSLEAGDRLGFRMRTGSIRVRYHSSEDAKISWNGTVVSLPRGEGWQEVSLANERRNVELRALSGKVVLEHAIAQ